MNQAGEIVAREKPRPLDPEAAARELPSLAVDSARFLAVLLDNQPELCARIASNHAAWPVLADMTGKNWQLAIRETLGRLGLGSGIGGFVTAARDGKDNIVREWAASISDTLFQTRWRIKEAGGKDVAHDPATPAWVLKTIDLPPFTKADATEWARRVERGGCEGWNPEHPPTLPAFLLAKQDRLAAYPAERAGSRDAELSACLFRSNRNGGR